MTRYEQPPRPTKRVLTQEAREAVAVIVTEAVWLALCILAVVAVSMHITDQKDRESIIFMILVLVLPGGAIAVGLATVYLTSIKWTETKETYR